MKIGTSRRQDAPGSAVLAPAVSYLADGAHSVTRPTMHGLDVVALQHFGDGGVELLAAADFVEAFQQILGSHPRALGALQIVKHLAAMHHHDAVAEVDGLMHGVRDPECRQLVTLTDFVSQTNDLLSSSQLNRHGVL